MRGCRLRLCTAKFRRRCAIRSSCAGTRVNSFGRGAKPNGPSRIVVRRVKDGLKSGLSTEIAEISATKPEELGKALDAAWIEYMKQRPLTARGYLDNPHGKWMRSVGDQMVSEERELRSRAVAGTLLAPGRKPGERPPYL